MEKVKKKQSERGGRRKKADKEKEGMGGRDVQRDKTVQRCGLCRGAGRTPLKLGRSPPPPRTSSCVRGLFGAGRSAAANILQQQLPHYQLTICYNAKKRNEEKRRLFELHSVYVYV